MPAARPLPAFAGTFEGREQRLAVRASQTRAAVPSRSRLVSAVVSRGDIAQRSGSLRVERWVQESHGLADLFVEQRNQCRPQGRNGTGSPEDGIFPVHVDLVAGGGVRIARDIGHSAAFEVIRIYGYRHLRAALVGRK